MSVGNFTISNVTELQVEFDPALAGVGKQHRVMVWTGSREKELPMHWGLPSADPEIGEIPLLRSEAANIDNPASSSRTRSAW